MTRERAEEILDGPGRAPQSHDYPRATERQYRICGRGWRSARLIVLYAGKDALHMQNAMWIKAPRGSVLVL